MKQFFLFLMLTASVIFAGCRQTSVDGVTPSEEELAWEKTIRGSYSGYRPPRCAAPAAFDNTSSRRSAVMKKATSAPAAPAADAKSAIPAAEELDPMVVVDSAAEVTSSDPDAEQGVKADAPKADAKAEVKADAPKAEVKADAPKADAPKAEVKKAGEDPLEPTASTVYIVKSGDTLGGISKHFYGSARYYEVITRANVDLVKNPNALKPGMKLIIPKL